MAMEKNVNNPKGLVIAGLLAILIGCGIFFGSGGLKAYQTAEAVVTRIEYDQSHTAGDDSPSAHFYIDYTADGVEYHDVELNAVNIGMKQGKHLTVQYDPADPSHVRTRGVRYLALIIAGLGILAILFSLLSMKKK